MFTLPTVLLFVTVVVLRGWRLVRDRRRHLMRVKLRLQGAARAEIRPTGAKLFHPASAGLTRRRF